MVPVAICVCTVGGMAFSFKIKDRVTLYQELISNEVRLAGLRQRAHYLVEKA